MNYFLVLNDNKTLSIKLAIRHSKPKNNSFSKFVTVMVLSILPLALVKVLQSTWLGGHQIHFHESKIPKKPTNSINLLSWK
jgi:hypothetical protein